jgi:hypothetical protein
MKHLVRLGFGKAQSNESDSISIRNSCQPEYGYGRRKVVLNVIFLSMFRETTDFRSTCRRLNLKVRSREVIDGT